MENNLYDVVIVGAGPAGSSAANELAKNGYRTLLVEKHSLPREKSCSGILIKKSIELVRSYFGEEVPDIVKCKPYVSNGMVFTDEIGEEFRFEQAGLNIWRSLFDHWLIQRAIENGAELMSETTVLSCDIEKDFVNIKMKSNHQFSVDAKYLIVCDGAAGSLRGKLINTKRTNIITYQTFCKGSIDLEPGYFYAYLQKRLSEYDAWFNVKDDYLIFGVAVKKSANIKQYHSEFIGFMKEVYNARDLHTIKSETWLMPEMVKGFPIHYGHGHVLFAGEAAGFLNPMGEGISCGLESGYAAAKAIITNFDKQENLIDAYREYSYDIRNYMIRQWYLVADLAPKFNYLRS